MPVPPGGLDGFNLFINSKIIYPAEDKKNEVQGRVIAQFVVEKDGSLSNIKILSQPSVTLGNEAIRVLKLSSKWTPGLQNGSAVRVRYTIPINFSLGN
nr:energy transducer TonB [Mucilaginibacter rivuli]